MTTQQIKNAPPGLKHELIQLTKRGILSNPKVKSAFLEAAIGLKAGTSATSKSK